MGIAVWRVTIKPKNRSIFGHVGFRPEKNVCLPTQLGACSHPTGRPTVPYLCTMDVRTHCAFHGVPTGLPGPRRGLTAARRPVGGSAWLIFIGGPRFGLPATPIGAGRGYCKAFTKRDLSSSPARKSQMLRPSRMLQVHWRTPIGAAHRPNRAGAY